MRKALVLLMMLAMAFLAGCGSSDETRDVPDDWQKMNAGTYQFAVPPGYKGMAAGGNAALFASGGEKGLIISEIKTDDGVPGPESGMADAEDMVIGGFQVSMARSQPKEGKVGCVFILREGGLKTPLMVVVLAPQDQAADLPELGKTVVSSISVP